MSTSTATAGGGGRWFEKPAGTPQERFPVLGDAFGNVARCWTDSFSALSASPGDLAFEGLRATTVGELAPTGGVLPIFASLRVPAWDCLAGLALGRPVVSAVVEAFFGGGDDGDDAPAERPMSPVEMRIVDVIGGQAATALTAGFKDFVPTRFEFDRTQARADAAFLGKRGAPMIAATFALKAVGRDVRFEVVLPRGALEAREAAWSGSAAGRPAPLDPVRWTSRLQAEVVRATMPLQARVEVGALTLGAIAAWRPGHVVELPAEAGREVLLTCEEELLFRCELGQSAGRYTLRVGERAVADHPPSRKDA